MGALGVRFLLLFAMASQLPTAEVGLFGVATATVTISVYLIGLELYTFTSRQLLASAAAAPSRLLATQFSISVCAALIVIPLLIIIVVPRFIPPRLTAWLVMIAICEYVGQEIYRLLVTYGRVVEATVNLAIRTASWAAVAAVWLTLADRAPSIDAILHMWLLGSAASVVSGALNLKNKIPLRELVSARPEARLVKEAVACASKYLVASLSLRSLEFLDRFLLTRSWGAAATGVYTWYWTLANAANVMLVAGVINVWYSRLISAIQSESGDEVLAASKALRRSFTLWSVVLVLAAPGVAFIATYLIGRDEYLQQFGVGVLLIAAAVASAAAQVPQLHLYALGRDKEIARACFAGAAFALGLNLLLIPRYAAMGAAVSYLAGALLIFGLYMFELRRYHAPAQQRTE